MQLKSYMMPDFLLKNTMSITKFYRDQEGVQELQGVITNPDLNLNLDFCLKEDEIAVFTNDYNVVREFDYEGIPMKCVISSPKPLESKESQIDEQIKRFADFLNDTFRSSQ